MSVPGDNQDRALFGSILKSMGPDDVQSSVDSGTIDKEIYVPRKGEPRQAGVTESCTPFIKRFKELAEQNLFVFSKGVMGRKYLTNTFHRSVADWMQKCPPYRKGCLLPRNHAKTSLATHCLPVHILIQPEDNNIYFPGTPGTDSRILLSGETEKMACKNLSVIRQAFEGNQILRGLWPECCWDTHNGKGKESWNNLAIILPRETTYPDPSVRAVGVDGAITGSRPNVQIKDDLVSLKAANSSIVMQDAIRWHTVSNALMEEYEEGTGLAALEWIVGCLTSDTVVTMDTGDKKRICDVKEGDYVHSPNLNGTVERRRVNRVIPQGFAETWTVSTTSHDIRATGNHPFLISVGKSKLGWRRADQLRVGDLVVAHKSLYSYRGVFDSEAEFCWLFGFMLGDGWVNARPRKGYVCFAPGIDEALNQRVLSALKHFVPCNKWYLTKNRYYRTDSTEAARFFVDWGFAGDAKTKRVPNWVYKLTKAKKAAFVQGFCDADGGWLHNRAWRVEISNRALLEDLKHVACLCGIRTGRTLVRDRVVHPPSSKVPVRSVCYGASFNFATIDRHETPNKNLYGGLNVGRDTKLSPELRFERVVLVSRNKISEEVWDLTINGNPAFFANGLAVHNTRWAVYDLYSHMMEGDPEGEIIADETYEWMVRGVIEDGIPIWPERFTPEKIEALHKRHGNMFYLLYMNSATNSELIDFDVEMIRDFQIVGTKAMMVTKPGDAVITQKIERMKTEYAPEPDIFERGERMDSKEFFRRIRESNQGKQWAPEEADPQGAWLRMQYGDGRSRYRSV